jgi:hypothetical protein
MLALLVALACGAADPGSLCDGTRLEVTAGPNPQDGPILDANVTYAVSGFAPGKKSYVVFEAQTTGAFEIYGSTAAKVCDQRPTCAAETKSCMRSVAAFVFQAGERYEIELPAIAPGQRVLIHVRAPDEEDQVANAQRPSAMRLAVASLIRTWSRGPRLRHPAKRSHSRLASSAIGFTA